MRLYKIVQLSLSFYRDAETTDVCWCGVSYQDVIVATDITAGESGDRSRLWLTPAGPAWRPDWTGSDVDDDENWLRRVGVITPLIESECKDSRRPW